MINSNNIIKTRISTVKLKSKEILQIDIVDDQVFEKKDMIELIDAAYKLGGGKKFKNLIYVGEFTVPDLKAIKLSCSKAGSIYKIADAFIIHTLSQKIIANFYLKIQKPVVPTKFFSNTIDAEKWLLGI